VTLQFADGLVAARTEGEAAAPPPEGAPPARKRAPRRAKAAPAAPAPTAAQGSLFEA
jgi:hypothetical protein